MTIDIDPKEASQRVLAHAAEGRLIQGSWHRESKGRHLACLLGSMGNSVEIDSPESCPASLMPPWMAHLVVDLFDKQIAKDAFAWAVRIGTQMGHHRWPAIEWESVRVEFLVSAITDALESARKVAAKESYWAQVESAHRLVVEALRGNGDLGAAASAARAAASAENAAENAAESAAWSAAWSAESAAWSAERSAESAAWSAADAASAQADRLCDLIDARLAVTPALAARPKRRKARRK